MVIIETGTDYQTVITTYDVTPGTFVEVLEGIRSAYTEFLCEQPGFISSALHVNDAQTRIASYSTWRDRKSFQAVLRSSQMQERNRILHDKSKGFEPVLYEVDSVFSASDQNR